MEPQCCPGRFAFGAGAFSLATGPDGELAIASNGTDANEDNIFRLVDLNSDGDYLDADETIVYASRQLTGFFPERPRVVEYALAANVPEPTSTVGLLVAAAFGLGAIRRKLNS